MNYRFDTSLIEKYHSRSQRARVMSESWLYENLYCPCCGEPHLVQFENNRVVADFYCQSCKEEFELKSKCGKINGRITNGTYETAIKRVSENHNPGLFALQYDSDFFVKNLYLIPKFFFTPDVFEKRKPLAKTARRAGWVGSNILLNCIPDNCKIVIIQESNARNKSSVIADYSRCRRLETKNIFSRGWLLDTFRCVEKIGKELFCLNDVYAFLEELSILHPNNNYVKAKIRQQLQILRKNGFIEFLGRGVYKKVF